MDHLQDHPEWSVSGDLDIGGLDIGGLDIGGLDINDLDLFLSESYDPTNTGYFNEGHDHQFEHVMGVEVSEDSGHTFPTKQTNSLLSASHPASENIVFDSESIRYEGTKAPKPRRRRNASPDTARRTRKHNGRQPLDHEPRFGDSDQTLFLKRHRMAQKRHREKLRADAARAATEAQSQIAALGRERDTLKTENSQLLDENARLQSMVWDYELGTVEPEEASELKAEFQRSKTSLSYQQKKIEALQALVDLRTRSECLLKEQNARLERIIAIHLRGLGGQHKGTVDGVFSMATSDSLGTSGGVDDSAKTLQLTSKTSSGKMYQATVEADDDM